MLKSNSRDIFYYVIVVSLFLLGFILRLKGFISNPSCWRDECALAWNIKFKSYVELFGPLRFLQVAPPFFLVASKFLANIFNAENTLKTRDLVLRLIPFVCGVLSIPVFYLVSKELFCSKKTIVLALLFFVTSSSLIDYSYEFKPYEVDVFCSLLLILFFLRLDLSKISFKKLFFSSLGVALTMWFSLASCFVIAAGCGSLILKRKEPRKILALFIPVLISLLLYLKFYILGVHQGSGSGMAEFWGDKFILPNFSNFLYLLTENIRYFFFPAKAILFILIFVIYGGFIYFKEKNYVFTSIFSLIFILLIFASVFHLYPFSNRLLLFLIPIFILLITKSFDKISVAKKIKSFFIIFMMLCVVYPQAVLSINKATHDINKGDFSREMMGYIAIKIQPKDKIFVNNASRADYCYYSSFFNVKNEVIYDDLGNSPNQEYSDSLDNLPPGNYWFFLPYDYSPQRVMINHIKNWAIHNTEVLETREATQSLLMYLEIKKKT